MTTTLIKIDRVSIRENPKSGETTTIAVGPTTVSFEYKGALDIPNPWVDKIIVTEKGFTYSGASDMVSYINGILLNAEESTQFIEEVGKLGELIMHYDRKRTVINHMPESAYLYTYENTAIECSNCHSKIIWKTIEEKESANGEFLYEICPSCGEADTFDYELEKIEDALK